MFTREPVGPARTAFDGNKRADKARSQTPDSDWRDTQAAPPPIGGHRTGSQRHDVEESLSIIGHDLTIGGQGLSIYTPGKLRVEGRVEGDVSGSDVVIGEKGRVVGVVSGRSVEVLGEVAGTVKGADVTLASSARVNGDIVHNRLIVLEGAQLDGRVRRAQEQVVPGGDPSAPASAGAPEAASASETSTSKTA